MASPNSGRRSYARRAHYGAFAAYVVAIIGVFAGLLSAVVWVVDPVGFGNLRMIASEAVAPVARLINGGTSSVSGADESVAAWWQAGSQNRELRADLTKMRRDVQRAQGLEAENRQLRALLGIAQGEVPVIVTASILSSTATSTRRHAVIDAGTSDGVRSGQPVRSADGLIGRTLEVGPTVARVLLITDRRSVVPARRASDGLAVLVTGRGDDILDVRTLNSATVTLKVGDLIIASGSGGLYQPRTPVARIIRITADGALAHPVADPASAAAIIVQPASNAGADEPPPSQDAAVEADANADEAATDE